MEKLNFEEFVSEVYSDGYDEGYHNALEAFADLYADAIDAVMEMLTEQGMTMSETLLVMNALELHSQILDDMILDVVNDELCDCSDCESCPFCDED